MAFNRPTLAELVTRTRADFRSRLEIEGSLLRRAVADVFAVVWAGGVHLLHGHLEWLGKQLNHLISEREALYAAASMYGIAPTAATYASGTVTATGTDTSPIPLDTILVRDDGVQYRVTAGTTITGTDATVSVEAVEAGADGDLGAGETLTFESPLAGVDAEVTVDAPGIDGGENEEDVEEVRARFLLRLQEPPAGGRDPDYEGWALAVSGVTRAWVYPNENGLGTVVVRFVRDDDTPILPDAGEVAAVQAALDAERPITVEVTAEAPTSLAVDFTIAVTPDTSTVRDAVEAELGDLLLRDGEPGDGVDRGTIYLSRILTAIGVAEGVEDFTLTAPVADVVPALGQLPQMGTITWS